MEDVSDGSPVDQTIDSVDSSEPPDSGTEGSLDAENDITTSLDAPSDNSLRRDAKGDAPDATREASADAGCGAVGESCCEPGYVCASGLNCDGTNLQCVCLYEMCGDQCVDEWSDKNNCGACGNTCTASEVCNSGHCGCSYNWTVCPGGARIDTQGDPANCGACGVSCQIVTGDPSAQCVYGGCRTKSVVTGGTNYYGLAVDDTALYYSTGTTVEALPNARRADGELAGAQEDPGDARSSVTCLSPKFRWRTASRRLSP
jgi:hypothetical protein